MGIPTERYSKITDKNQREICLLKAFPCAWGKCAFCDYIEDNSRDEAGMIALNNQVLNLVTGEYGVLEVINSGSCFELPKETLNQIEQVICEKNINKLFFEAHWIYKNQLAEMRDSYARLQDYQKGVKAIRQKNADAVAEQSWNFTQMQTAETVAKKNNIAQNFPVSNRSTSQITRNLSYPDRYFVPAGQKAV